MVEFVNVFIFIIFYIFLLFLTKTNRPITRLNHIHKPVKTVLHFLDGLSLIFWLDYLGRVINLGPNPPKPAHPYSHPRKHGHRYNMNTDTSTSVGV
jgi:hypothetical protein